MDTPVECGSFHNLFKWSFLFLNAAFELYEFPVSEGSSQPYFGCELSFGEGAKASEAEISPKMLLLSKHHELALYQVLLIL